MDVTKPATRPDMLRDVAAVVVIATVALATRVSIATAVPPSAPVADMQEYWEKAVFIATHGRVYENSWRMPGYPVALATTFALGGGPSLELARSFNAVAGTLAALLTYWLARRSAAHLASAGAGLAVALYPSFIIYTTFIATEVVVTVPLMAALIASTFPSRRAAALSGVCTGLATLIRPAAVALLPALLATLSRRGKDGRAEWSAVHPALAVILFSMTLAPWWLHNAHLYGRFVPLDTTGGINLLIGTGPLANGHWDWSAVSRLHAEYLPNVDVRNPEGSDRATALARTFLREHPGTVLRLVPAKLSALLALEGREHAYLYSFGYFGSRQALTVWLWGLSILAAFPLVLLAAIGGSTVRGGVATRVLVPCGLFLATTVAMHLVSFGDPRFHLPFVPILAVLATGLIRWRTGVVPWRAVLAAVLILLLAFAWRDQLMTYWAALVRLAAPGGSSSLLSFDDLL